MRPLLLAILLAGLGSGCAVGLRLDLTRERASSTPPPTGPSLGALLLTYREEVERYCTAGTLVVLECAAQRRVLRGVFDAASEEERRLRLGGLATEVDVIHDELARARLGAMVETILRRLG